MKVAKRRANKLFYFYNSLLYICNLPIFKCIFEKKIYRLGSKFDYKDPKINDFYQDPDFRGITIEPNEEEEGGGDVPKSPIV